MSLKIGLIGAPGAGKDTIADFLVNNKNFKRLAFADAIKNEYYKKTNISEETFKNARGTLLEKEIQLGLWEYSDKIRAKYGDLHFVTPVINEAKKCEKSLVITDIRTILELEQVNSLGVKLIFIVRDLSLGKTIPGTRINYRDIIGVPVFFNHSEDLNVVYTEFEIFFKKILKGE